MMSNLHAIDGYRLLAAGSNRILVRLPILMLLQRYANHTEPTWMVLVLEPATRPTRLVL
jgi:hypothetical protein